MKIEKSVNLPKPRNSVVSKIDGMCVGDSVFFEGVDSQSETIVDSTRKAMRRKGWSPMVRTTADGVRIWRTK